MSFVPDKPAAMEVCSRGRKLLNISTQVTTGKRKLQKGAKSRFPSQRRWLRYLCMRGGIGKHAGNNTLGVRERCQGSQQHRGIPEFPWHSSSPPREAGLRASSQRLRWSAASPAQPPSSWDSKRESLWCLPREISLWLLKAQMSYFKRKEAFVVPSLVKTYPGNSGLLQAPIFVLQLLIISMVNGH